MNSLQSPFLKQTKLSTWLALLALPVISRVEAAPTNVVMRDPSTIMKRDGVFWMYGTGAGTRQFSSIDKLNWTEQGAVLPQAPTWVATAVPQNKNNIAWAPDVAYFGGKYRLYYCYSTLGSNQSVIGLATNKTLDPKGWTDEGIVVQSGESTSFNAIDPGVFQDGEGRWWMSFGSYFDGIHLLPLDENTGKRRENSQMTRIATRPGVATNPIEASTIYFHDGWYYLFVNWGSCLQGPRSTYNIRVGRSQSVTGAYADRTGQRMLEGGGSLFLSSIHDDGTNRAFDDQVAPGHVGILREGDEYTLSTHYEWSRHNRGGTTVNVNALTWDSDGWPRAVLDPTPIKIVSLLGTRPVLEVKGEAAAGANIQTNFYESRSGQKWVLTHLKDGYYTIGNNGMVLGTVGDNSKAGARVELSPFRNVDSQQWAIRQNEDGSYTLLLKSSEQKVALDVAGASLNDETPVNVWTDNFLNAQKWAFHTR